MAQRLSLHVDFRELAPAPSKAPKGAVTELHRLAPRKDQGALWRLELHEPGRWGEMRHPKAPAPRFVRFDVVATRPPKKNCRDLAQWSKWLGFFNKGAYFEIHSHPHPSMMAVKLEWSLLIVPASCKFVDIYSLGEQLLHRTEPF